jgi:hypothetical protein
MSSNALHCIALQPGVSSNMLHCTHCNPACLATCYTALHRNPACLATRYTELHCNPVCLATCYMPRALLTKLERVELALEGAGGAIPKRKPHHKRRPHAGPR